MRISNRILLTLFLSSFFLSDIASAQTCYAAPSGLVSWWTMEGSVGDEVHRNAPMAAYAINFPIGKVARGVAFSPGGHIDIPHSEHLALQQLTLEAWVRPDGPGPNNDIPGSVILQKVRSPPLGDYSVSVALWWDAVEGRFHFGFGDYRTERIVSTNRFPTGQFHHVAGTYDGFAFRLYVNGKLEGERLLQKNITYDASTPWTIGSTYAHYRALGYPRTWNGVIDEVSIYSRALSPAEILAAYTADGAGKCPCIPAPTGAMSWWALEGSVGDAVNRSAPMAAYAINFPSGEVARGVAFNPGGHIDIPDSEQLALQQLTLEAWVRPDGPGPNNDIPGSVILQKVRSPPLGDYVVSVALWWDAVEGRFHFGFGDYRSERIASTNRFPTGQFYHVAGTYDGFAFRLYVNGKLEGERFLQKNITYDSSTPWTIGSTYAHYRALGYPRTWNGVIDEVGIYDRALSQSEVRAAVNAGGAGRCHLR